MVDVTRVVENLEKARDLIARPGGYAKHVRKTPRKEGGYAHCALGALDAVRGILGANNLELCDPHILALHAAVPQGLKGSHDPRWDIVNHNNLTDQQTVVSWFQRAIDMQREHPMEKA